MANGEGLVWLSISALHCLRQGSHPESTQWSSSTVVQLLSKLQVILVGLHIHFSTSQIQEERNTHNTQGHIQQVSSPVPPCETS